MRAQLTGRILTQEIPGAELFDHFPTRIEGKYIIFIVAVTLRMAFLGASLRSSPLNQSIRSHLRSGEPACGNVFVALLEVNCKAEGAFSKFSQTFVLPTAMHQ